MMIIIITISIITTGCRTMSAMLKKSVSSVQENVSNTSAIMNIDRIFKSNIQVQVNTYLFKDNIQVQRPRERVQQVHPASSSSSSSSRSNSSSSSSSSSSSITASKSMCPTSPPNRIVSNKIVPNRIVSNPIE